MQDLVIEVRNGINDQILGLARVSDIHTQLVDTGVDESILLTTHFELTVDRSTASVCGCSDCQNATQKDW